MDEVLPSPALKTVQTRYELRLEEVLDAAARLFNRQSFTAVTMEDVAADLNLMPATLYHYVTDKEELVFRCYSRVVESYQQELEAADEPGLDGLEKVRAFVRKRLSSTSGNRSTFADLASLSTDCYVAIKEGRRQNLGTLEKLIEQGIADGSITPSDARLTATGIMSVVDWLAFWQSSKEGHSKSAALIAIDDILTHGIYRRDLPNFEIPDVTTTLKTSTAGKREQKRAAILRTALIMFNRKGVAATSMEEIAKEAGVTRAALYYHAKDKAELLNLCIQRAVAFIEECEPSLTADSDLAKLTQARRYLYEGHASDRGPLPSYNNIDLLKPHHKEAALRHFNALDEIFPHRLQQAIDDGICRNVPVFFAEKLHDSLINRFALWYNENLNTPAQVIADNHTLLLINGLKPRR